DPAVDVEIRLRGKCRVQAADRADLCYPPGLREPRLLFDDRLVVEIDSLIARLLRETAETAGVDAEIGHIDVLVADIGDRIAGDLFPLFIGGGGDLPDIPVASRKKAQRIRFADPVSTCCIGE